MTKLWETLQSLSIPDYVKQEYKVVNERELVVDLSQEKSSDIQPRIKVPDFPGIFSSYLSSQYPPLLSAISSYLHVTEECILVTAGCDDALNLVSRLLIESDTKVCIPLPSFYRYEFHTKINGGNILFIPPKPFPYSLDVGNIIDEIRANNASVLFLTNPNNPTGLSVDHSEIIRILESHSGYVVLDEALADFAEITCADLVREYANLIIVRSFSKLFKLAGLRIGYIVANPEFIKVAKELASPFSVSSYAILRTLANVEDKSFIDAQIEDMRKLISIIKCCNSDKIKLTDTTSSLCLIKYTGEDKLYKILGDRGVKTISGDNFRGLEDENCVRITLNNKQDTEKFVSILNTVN